MHTEKKDRFFNDDDDLSRHRCGGYWLAPLSIVNVKIIYHSLKNIYCLYKP